MGMTSPFPEPDSPQLERFAVHPRAEIVAIMRALRESCVPITAYFGGDSAFGVTTLRSVEDDDTLVFEGLPSEAAQRQLIAAPKVTFVGFVDAIKLQFSSNGPRAAQYEGQPAFVVPLPSAVLRLQRREAMRVRPPMAKPANCRVPVAGAAGQFEALRVLDVSVGGVAVLTYPTRFELAPGALIENCQLDLPGVGGAAVSLRVRHVDPLPSADEARRCGCEFVRMAPAARSMLARYVDQLDADRRPSAEAGS